MYAKLTSRTGLDGSCHLCALNIWDYDQIIGDVLFLTFESGCHVRQSDVEKRRYNQSSWNPQVIQIHPLPRRSGWKYNCSLNRSGSRTDNRTRLKNAMHLWEKLLYNIMLRMGDALFATPSRRIRYHVRSRLSTSVMFWIKIQITCSMFLIFWKSLWALNIQQKTHSVLKIVL